MSGKTDRTRRQSLVLAKSTDALVDQKPFTTGDIHNPFQVQKKNIRTAALIVCTFTYLIIGACVFDALEDAPSNARKHLYEQQFAQFKRKHNMSNDAFRHLTDLIMNKTTLRNKWQFYDSFYFSTVVLALIGYGHRMLITKRAKIFCVLYATLGIPMWLITFQSAGERLNSLLSYMLSKIKQFFRIKKTKVTDGELLIMESLLSVVIMLVGASVFSKHEGWSFFNSFYYGFVTLTTIGFGDYVVLQKPDDNRTFIRHAEYFLFCIGFIFLGLTVVASLMNLLVIRIVAFYSQERLLEKLREEEVASQAVLLKGDVICSTKTHRPLAKSPSLTSGKAASQPAPLIYSSETSVCSCTCMETFSEWKQMRRKRAKWKKQHRDGRNKAINRIDSTEAMKIFLAMRRSSV